MELFLHTGKQALERPIQWKETRMIRFKKELFLVLSIISFNQLKVFFNVIIGTPGVNFMVRVSMLELYNEEVVDLLSGDRKQKLQIHEDKDKGVFVKDLSEYGVKTVADMNKKLIEGSKSRHVGTTEMNSVSSRSHSIFIIIVEQEQ